MLQRARGVPSPLIGIGIAALILLAASLPFPLAAAAGESDYGTLVVTGRSEIKAAPDMAFFDVGVETRAETVEKARELNAEAMARVRSALLAAGASPDNLKTTNFYVYPEWHYNRDDGTRTLIGYRIVHTLKVTVMDLDRLGALLDAALMEGANQVSGPAFGLKNPEELEAQALAEAARKARAKAEVLARASGAYLKGIAHISESVGTPVALPMVAAFSAKDAVAERVSTEISTGEVTVTATVSITFKI